MVYKRFLVTVLELLYVMNAIWGSYAHDHQDWEMNKYELLGPEEIDVPAHKELNGFSSTASTRKMALGGRKMAVQKVTRREIEKEQGLHGGAPEDNSGNEKNALDKYLGGSNDQLNNIKDSKALPTKTSLESRPSRADMDQEPQGSSALPKGEMQRLLDATKEIVNLMHKDYSAHARPGRKPPINNKVPIH
ncbi:hypothetical protein Peur_064188 [Populus x canadensis]